ncbi:MAG: preprotein translocase subunit YajC [Mucispirillum sp.]|nr:preprotein translocase subunit YajC [Mucispirillum sp.]
MFFETAAYAQTAAGAAPQTAMGGLMSFMPIILMVVIFYFLLIRPQQKRQKQHAAMIDALKAGDTVLTNAGLIGTIHSVDGNVMVIDLGGTKVRMIKGYIADKLDPATLNTAAEAPKENK